MDLSDENRKRITTPSGLPPADLIAPLAATPINPPIGPIPQTPPQSIPIGPITTPAVTPPAPIPEVQPIAMLKLDSSLVQPNQVQNAQIPWQYLLLNLYRLAQPTGVTPGQAGSVTVNTRGQVVSTQSTGATINSPNLTGTPTAVTQTAGDNTTAVATTAFVQQAIQQAQQWVQQQRYVPEPPSTNMQQDPLHPALYVRTSGQNPRWLAINNMVPITWPPPGTGQP